MAGLVPAIRVYAAWMKFGDGRNAAQAMTDK
jgi:hypothetical protein